MFEREQLEETERANDPYAVVERFAEIVADRTQLAIQNGEAERISDAAVVKMMTAAVKLYAAKVAHVADPFRPLAGEYDENVTATEVLTTTIELLRALGLGPMELGLWSHRKPRNYAYEKHPQDSLEASTDAEAEEKDPR